MPKGRRPRLLAYSGGSGKELATSAKLLTVAKPFGFLVVHDDALAETHDPQRQFALDCSNLLRRYPASTAFLRNLRS